MTWLWWCAAVAVLALVDRLATWAEGRGWIYWRRRRPSAGGGAGVLGGVADVFHPAQGVTVQERRYQDLRVDESGSGAPARSTGAAPGVPDSEGGTPSTRVLGGPGSPGPVGADSGHDRTRTR